MNYNFGDFKLDTQRAELWQNGTEIALEPKAYALLCLLLGNHDRLVSRDELIEKVWDGRIVSEAVISTGIKSLRRALGDDGDTQKYIKTIRGRGFRFSAPVRLSSAIVASVRDNADPAGLVEPSVQGTKPTIAILPFKLLGYSE
ncbi:MAG: winged helix-turn-helix domain-containing protein [Paracoccaceae bacterium]